MLQFSDGNHRSGKPVTFQVGSPPTLLGGATDQPVAQRLVHIDALRGLALLGVIVMNIGSMAMSINAGKVLADATPAEIGIMAADILLMFGKARASFAFLFGAGFAILYARACANGAAFQPFYVRRLIALLLFGLVNQIFLFAGDILVTYALLGLVLLCCRAWSNETLLKAGILLTLAPPMLQGLLEALSGFPLPDLVELPIAERMARGLVAYTSPFYLDAVRENITLGLTRHLTATAPMIVGDLGIFGLFLLGAWSARTGALTDPQRHASMLRRIAWCGIPIGLLLSAVNMLPMLGIRSEGLLRGAITASSIAAPVLAAGYLAALALLFARTGGWIRSLLAAAGQMALTTYLLSGAIGTWVLYGYGLGMLDAFGVVQLTSFGIGLFVALAVFSRIWLEFAPQGPAEWVWRHISYGGSKRERGRRFR